MRGELEGYPNPVSGLVRSTPPATEPVSLTEAKLHVRQDGSGDDALITSLIQAAREYVESYTNRSLITQTWKLYLDRFPCEQFIYLPRPNLLTISSISYVDLNGQTQTWSSANYIADTASLPGAVRLAYQCFWPGARTQAQSVCITYTAGYGAAASVPEAIKSAMKLCIGHWYMNRESVAMGGMQEIPMAVEALLGPYRVVESA